MINVVGVRFKTASKIYYFDPGKKYIQLNDNVIVETIRGVEFGEVVVGPKEVPDEEIVASLKPVLRVATNDDKKINQENKSLEREAFRMCFEKIQEHELIMKLIDVEYTFDKNKIIFYFTADGRVDFRELVKDLAAIFKTRIELRQIGVRDEAKMLGGLGPCGRPLCCKKFLNEFCPVSIKMAKEQNLSLNPAKISGICSRLMCCLNFEHEGYEENLKLIPNNGTKIIDKETDRAGVVLSSNVLSLKVRVKLFSNKDGDEEIIVERMYDDLVCVNNSDERYERMAKKDYSNKKNRNNSKANTSENKNNIKSKNEAKSRKKENSKDKSNAQSELKTDDKKKACNQCETCVTCKGEKEIPKAYETASECVETIFGEDVCVADSAAIDVVSSEVLPTVSEQISKAEQVIEVAKTGKIKEESVSKNSQKNKAVNKNKKPFNKSKKPFNKNKKPFDKNKKTFDKKAKSNYIKKSNVNVDGVEIKQEKPVTIANKQVSNSRPKKQRNSQNRSKDTSRNTPQKNERNTSRYKPTNSDLNTTDRIAASVEKRLNEHNANKNKKTGDNKSFNKKKYYNNRKVAAPTKPKEGVEK